MTQEDHWSWEDPLEKGMAIHSSIQIGKEVCEGRILSPCFFNLYAEYIMQNVRLDESHGKGLDLWDHGSRMMKVGFRGSALDNHL